MSVWRNNDFILNMKRNLSNEQYKRFYKILNEQFYVLEILAEELKFKISGSTQNVYSISIDKTLCTFSCDCPDAKSHCINKKCLCKHIVFVLVRVLKYYDIDVYKELKFDEEKFLPFLEKIKTSYVEDLSLTNLSLNKKYKLKINNDNIENSIDKFSAYPFEEDYECSICYDLLNIQQELLGCPTCKQSFHKDCFNKWLQSSNYKNCVYCRSNIWKEYGKKNVKSSDYINLI
jgi:hypothetical protein